MNIELLYKITELLLMEIDEVVNIDYGEDNSNSAKLILSSGQQYTITLNKA